MDSLNQQQLAVIRALFEGAEAAGFPLWLESGWAIDARLGRITRPHGDIDVAYPKDREEEYLALLQSLGFSDREDTDYGFLIWNGPVLLDTEPCHPTKEGYGFDGFPAGSCPWEAEGELEGYPVRCLSWEAMYAEFQGYLEEIPQADWREHDFESLRLIQVHLAEATKERLRA